ncbi:MAG: 4-hydroxybenzoate octaprenyltransferase [Pirellulaceae bacterium]|nr:4-hydroxybenzoate octaprenyltransferase [Pirellulaceae bacterium]
MTPPGSAIISPSFSGRLGLVARDIKLSHSVFALPVALLATFMAAGAENRLPRVATLVLIILCMVLGRTVAMAANRAVDAPLDAMNPRTAGRAIPSGRLNRSFMLGMVICCSAGFVVTTAGFWVLYNNPWPTLLSAPVLTWLVGYSFTKRFTWLCHLFLGVALALSPLAAAIAVNPAYMAKGEPYLLALMTICWVAGFDVIYALADIKADRTNDVFSMPANLGVRRALSIAAALHLVSITALVALLRIGPQLSQGFAIGIGFAGALLLIEHTVVWASGTRHIHLTFFTLNGLVSIVLGALGIVDVVRAVVV